VPSFNQARFLSEALDSILAQDYRDVEVLVIDGGSTDGSLEILRAYGDGIRYWSGRDRGQADAVNRGFGRASGEILGWLNSDDRYVAGAIGKAVAALQTRPEAAMVYGDGELIDEGGVTMGLFGFTRPFDLWTLINGLDYIMQPTVFMRAGCVLAVGGLDETLHYGLDWDLWIRLGCRWPVIYLPETLAQSREYRATKTATGGWRRLRELRSIMARHGATGWPPGAVAYGLDTLRHRLPAVFGPSSKADVADQRGRLAPRLCRPMHRLVGFLIDAQLARLRTVWPDGWMGPVAHQALPWNGDPGCLRVVAEIPEDPRLLPSWLEVRAVGHSVKVVRVEAGRFEVALELPIGPATPRALVVTIRAGRWGRRTGDSRRLACRLHSVSFDPVVPLPGATPPSSQASAQRWS
jgi:hypothetical protein